MIITTNRNFKDWGNLFGDRVIASAIIDRIVHHATIVKLNGNSYRVKNLMELQNLFANEESQTGKRGRPRKQENELTGEHENQWFFYDISGGILMRIGGGILLIIYSNRYC